MKLMKKDDIFCGLRGKDRISKKRVRRKNDGCGIEMNLGFAKPK